MVNLLDGTREVSEPLAGEHLDLPMELFDTVFRNSDCIRGRGSCKRLVTLVSTSGTYHDDDVEIVSYLQGQQAEQDQGLEVGHCVLEM
jgi:hypothetical protein